MKAPSLCYACLCFAVHAAAAGGLRSELELTHPPPAGPTNGAGSIFFISSAVGSRPLLIEVAKSRVKSLVVPAGFPYEVTLTGSATPRYVSILLFIDAKKGLVDSFGITPTDSVELTDEATHKDLLEIARRGGVAFQKQVEETFGPKH